AAGPASGSGGWWNNWFGRKERPQDQKPGSPAEKPGTLPAPPEDAVSIREREYKAYWRRSDVCLRLKQAAQAAGNEEEVRRIEQLEDRIWAVFQQHVANLPNARTSEQDEATLEQNLNTLGRKPALLTPDRSEAGGPRAGLYRGWR